MEGNMKPHKYFFKLLDILTVLCLIIFFASFGFKDSKSSGWYQQWFPNMNGSTIASLTFLDSLTGYAVTSTNSSVQAYILKTTNGGDNWNIIYTYIPPSVNSGFKKIQFANSNTGFASTNYTNFFKTTNAGLNWTDLSSVIFSDDDMAVINVDTIICVSSSGFDGGVFRTTNGGLNWQALGPTGGSGQPSKIYMFNKDIGFCQGGQMRKTTNGGVNWFVISGEEYQDIKFIDTINGWKTYGTSIIGATTNGGLNWIPQQLPNIGHAYNYTQLSVINKDIIWMIGNSYYFGLLYKTTNGGTNWGYQLADTSIHITLDRLLYFVNNKMGWASSIFYDSEIHTKKGGNDTTFYTNIKEQITNISEKYKLFQNYPNPFNSMANVKVQMLKQGFVELKVFDISGKLVKTLLKQNLYSGEHKVSFNTSDLTSGVYFYTLFVDGNRVDTKKAILLK
jgi:photosystem II stability/assembly factor-like uncharacterized protein